MCLFPENPCLITFSQPPAVMTNNTVTLTCSTSISCNSDPQINTLEQGPSPKWLSFHSIANESETTKSTNLSFTASWEDDGRVFSCQTSENKDKYLNRNVTLTVECKSLKYILVSFLTLLNDCRFKKPVELYVFQEVQITPFKPQLIMLERLDIFYNK